MNELINDISSFTNVDFGEVRVWTDENGASWFFGMDICRALGYAKPWQAIRKNVDEVDTRIIKVDTRYAGPAYVRGIVYPSHPEAEHVNPLVEGRHPKLPHVHDFLVINESGLYQLVLRSRKPEAQAFKRWVTDAVLPSIRERGLYIQRELLEDNERLNRTIDELRADITVMKPKADYFDDYMQHGDTMCITQIAPMYGISARRLHKILYENGVICRLRRGWQPKTKYSENGYMVPVTYEYRLPGDPRPRFRRTWEWTPKGEYFIHQLLVKLGLAKR